MNENRLAILIGSSEFPEEPKLQQLQAPIKDVERLAATLKSEDRGHFASVSILNNRPHYEVVRDIQRTLNKANKDDLVLLYYSGHGKLNRSGHLYLTASDTVLSELESSSIAIADILNFVDVSKAQRVLVILDCCYSGAVGDVFSKGSVDDQLQLASTQGRGTYIMTASTGIQTAQEKEGDQQSVFTKHLVKGIESGEADQDRDGMVTVDELYDYVHRKVREESHQEPTRWGLDVRGQFIVSKSGRQPRKERANELRALLLSLAEENRIRDDILTSALEIIKTPVEKLSEDQQIKDSLLQNLLEKKLQTLDFVVEWVQIAPRFDLDERKHETSSSQQAETIKRVKQKPNKKPSVIEKPTPAPVASPQRVKPKPEVKKHPEVTPATRESSAERVKHQSTTFAFSSVAEPCFWFSILWVAVGFASYLLIGAYGLARSITLFY